MSRQTIDVYLGKDHIYTDSTGIKQLLEFYDDCNRHEDCTINIRLEFLEWLDGNLCALLGALIYRLQQDNNLEFSIDSKEVVKKCAVLLHNDFISLHQDLNSYKNTTSMPFKGFYPKQKDEFIEYLESDLLAHPAMPTWEDKTKEKLIDDLIEVYANIDKHAETLDPFFVCGQYYPVRKLIRFTICDLGVGFLKKIQQNVPSLVNDHGQAILWAIKGQSTKKDAPGGQGLKNLYNYLSDSGGGMQICSGNSNWCSKTMNLGIAFRPNGIATFNSIFTGAAISLEFNKKNLN